MIEITERKKDLIVILNVIGKIVYEASITFKKEGIYIRSAHPSNCSMIIVNIDKSLFEKYDIEKEITYTLDMASLLKIFSNLCGDNIIIELDKDELIFKSNKRKFCLNYFVGAEDNRPKPIFEYTNKAVLKPVALFDALNICLEFDQIGNFEVKEGKLFLHSKSHLVKGDVEINFDKLEGEDENAFYDLSYIKATEELKDLFEKIDMQFNNNTPLTILGEKNGINVEFILAARME